jgi:hypothetical protein
MLKASSRTVNHIISIMCGTDNKEGAIMFYIIVILAAIFAMPAKADETLKWRHVQHTTSVQTLQVGDVNGYTLNLFRLVGIAFFPDGSTGKTLVVGTSDVIAGSAVNGYYILNFDDGSALWLNTRVR